jgi:glyoxylase-like metal-dependent hydrolase (beta-lactamase superfamily II)
MIHRLTDNIYYSLPVAETDRPLLGFIAGSKASLMVDSGTSPAHARDFLTAAAPYGTTPPAYQFLTHWHWDHVFAIPTVGAECIAHELTAEKLREMQGMAWDDAGLEALVESGFLPRFGADCLKQEMPSQEERVIGSADRIFSGSLELDLGGLTCRIEHLGGTHTADSSVLYVPEAGVVFAGDCIYGRRFAGAYGYRLDELSRMAEQLASYDAQHYLISHEPPFSRDELMGFLERLLAVGRAVGDETDIGRAKERFSDQYGRSPDEEEAEMLAMFTGPNGAPA